MSLSRCQPTRAHVSACRTASIPAADRALRIKQAASCSELSLTVMPPAGPWLYSSRPMTHSTLCEIHVCHSSFLACCMMPAPGARLSCHFFRIFFLGRSARRGLGKCCSHTFPDTSRATRVTLITITMAASCQKPTQSTLIGH